MRFSVSAVARTQDMDKVQRVVSAKINKPSRCELDGTCPVTPPLEWKEVNGVRIGTRVRGKEEVHTEGLTVQLRRVKAGTKITVTAAHQAPLPMQVLFHALRPVLHVAGTRAVAEMAREVESL